jgi:hypothetical protein
LRPGEDKRGRLLALIGVNELGEKKLLVVEAGYRESGWREIPNVIENKIYKD